MTENDPTSLMKTDDAAIAMLTEGSANFHPAIQLLNSNSKIVIAQKARGGDFWFDEKALPKEFTIIVITYRAHAVHIENGVKKLESFNQASPVFAKIRATTRNYSGGQDIRYGISFLVYLPAVAKFGVFHPNIPSARPVGKEILIHLKKPEERTTGKDLPYTMAFTLSSLLRESAQPHYVPKVTPMKLEPDDIPSKDEIEAALKIFKAPVESESKVTEAKEGDDR